MEDTKLAQQRLLKELETYVPFDEDERFELRRLVNFLENNDNVYSRNNLTGHLTSSSWIVNKNRNKTLLVHHNMYKCWAPLGGHADDEIDLPEVALKEAREESGVQNIKILDRSILDITSMFVHTHEKRGKVVPGHFHFDIRYLLEADESEELIIAEREVSDVRWFSLEEIENLNIDIMSVVKRVMKKAK